jgi:hypothetical protein
LVIFTRGTSDVGVWATHAAAVNLYGVVGYYHASELANHPPFISKLTALALRASGRSYPLPSGKRFNVPGIPFRVLLRLPFALLDAGTTALLLSLLADKPWRYRAAAAYWLHPLAIIFSAYHGNTDSAVAFSLLLAVWFLARGNVIGAGIAVGAGFWIKIPGVLALPALLLMPEGWRKKMHFLCAAWLTAVLTYLPALMQDPEAVWRNVFGYRGLLVATATQEPIWGARVLLSMFMPAAWRSEHAGQIAYYLEHEWLLAILLLLAVTWLRRRYRAPAQVCGTIAIVYIVFYAFNDYWAYQYLAWSLPFWFFLPKWFLVPASAVASAYVYSLYSLYCGNPWLLGTWNYTAHPQWPEIILAFRDLAMVFFLGAAIWLLISSARASRSQRFNFSDLRE